MHSPFRHRLRRLKRGALAKLSLLSSPHMSLLGSPAPLRTMEYRGVRQRRNLVIFLPGIDDLAEDFERRGFIDDLQRHGVAADAIAVDAHYGYYASRTIHERITDDIIASARDTGYERIWLAGVSLGGFGAASYAARHASHIAGVLLFAPYLGGKELIREIAYAGGVDAWEPGNLPEGDYQRALWAWFKQELSGRGPTVPIYLGYGKRDMFEAAHKLLGKALPQKQVFAIPGGHDWRTWKQLWQMFLVDWKQQLG